MSSGFNVLSGDRATGALPPPASGVIPAGWSDELRIGTPSMTYNGWSLAEIEEPPRMRICAPAPGSPPFPVTWTPAARPWTSWLTLGWTPTRAVAVFTVATAEVTASRRCVP